LIIKKLELKVIRFNKEETDEMGKLLRKIESCLWLTASRTHPCLSASGGFGRQALSIEIERGRGWVRANWWRATNLISGKIMRSRDYSPYGKAPYVSQQGQAGWRVCGNIWRAALTILSFAWLRAAPILFLNQSSVIYNPDPASPAGRRRRAFRRSGRISLEWQCVILHLVIQRSVWDDFSGFEFKIPW